MKTFLLVGFAAVTSLPLICQTPRLHSDPMGFSYSVPEDWEAIIPTPPQAVAKPKTQRSTPREVKKGIACTEVPLTARHGNPVSAIVIVALPFDCFGQTMAAGDLAGFGAGITEGLKTTFDFLSPVSTTYGLAGHTLWIERIKAVPRGKSAPVNTVETACAILGKGAVCWMVDAADAASLDAFERAPVGLDGSALMPLVPAGVWVQGPAPLAAPQ